MPVHHRVAGRQRQFDTDAVDGIAEGLLGKTLGENVARRRHTLEKQILTVDLHFSQRAAFIAEEDKARRWVPGKKEQSALSVRQTFRIQNAEIEPVRIGNLRYRLG